MNLEQAKDLNHSPMWENVCVELDRDIAYNLVKLETAPPERVKEIQACIKTLRGLKALPQNVIDREQA